MMIFSLRFYNFAKLLVLLAIVNNPSSGVAHAFELANVEKELKASEALHSDIVPGAQKKISWHGTPATKTQISIVYLHGFSATHKELSPMTEQLAEKLGANVFYSRLSGHGRSDDAMAEATVTAWKKDAKEAYEIGATIGQQVLVIGTSTGGTLSTWLSAQAFADRLLANVLISPNFAIKSSAAWLLTNPLGLWIAKQLSGDYRSFEPANNFHAMYWTERYPLEALIPMLHLLDEVDDLDKSKISTPLMMIYSPDDQVIDVDKALDTASEFSSSEVSLVPFTTSTSPSQHVLVGYGSTTGSEVQEQVDTMLNILVPYAGELVSKTNHLEN